MTKDKRLNHLESLLTIINLLEDEGDIDKQDARKMRAIANARIEFLNS